MQSHECIRGCIRSFQINEIGFRNCTELCVSLSFNLKTFDAYNCFLLSCMQSGSCTHECDNLTAQCHPWIHTGCPIMCEANIYLVSTMNYNITYRAAFRIFFRGGGGQNGCSSVPGEANSICQSHTINLKGGQTSSKGGRMPLPAPPPP